MCVELCVFGWKNVIWNGNLRGGDHSKPIVQRHRMCSPARSFPCQEWPQRPCQSSTCTLRRHLAANSESKLDRLDDSWLLFLVPWSGTSPGQSMSIKFPCIGLDLWSLHLNDDVLHPRHCVRGLHEPWEPIYIGERNEHNDKPPWLDFHWFMTMFNITYCSP